MKMLMEIFIFCFSYMQEEKIATQWLQGLLGGDEAVNNDVFSSTSDVYFDRQVFWSTNIPTFVAVF